MEGERDISSDQDTELSPEMDLTSNVKGRRISPYKQGGRAPLINASEEVPASEVPVSAEGNTGSSLQKAFAFLLSGYYLLFFQTLWTDIKDNAFSAMTVALVTVPQSISLALASEASPAMGIITAIYGGFFGALSGGSAYSVQGPTGALSSLLAMYSVSVGMELLPWLAIGSGILTVVAYFLHIDKFCELVTQSVMEGFTLGVAFTVATNQLPYGLGLSVEKHVFLSYNVAEIYSHLLDADVFQSCLTLVSFLLLYFLNKWRPYYPWFFLMGVAGMTIGYLVDDDAVKTGNVASLTKGVDESITLELMKDRFPGLTQMQFFSLPNLTILQRTGPTILISGSVSMMLVAVMESLIAGKIAADHTNSKFNPHSEVFSLATANLACGAAGGFPCTAALPRTTLNISKGATSHMSAIMSSIGAAMIASFFMPALAYLPLAMIAAMMLRVSIAMPDWNFLKHMVEQDKQSLLVTLIVAFSAVTVDPSAGIVFGVAIEQLRTTPQR
eukprot:m.129049 g.129049  ORF g.129049 m.129049 type:complete len:500 (-) comp14570_c0_seq8:1119-2618(-)